jgi:hypothetical protein
MSLRDQDRKWKQQKSVFEKEEDHLTNGAEAFGMMAPMLSRSYGFPPDTAAAVNHIAVTFLREVVEQRQKGAKAR